MKTNLTRSPEEAAEFIRAGGLVAFPTETVYGLGADVFNPAAVAKIFEAKRRPGDNPLIAHIGEIGQAAELSIEIPAVAEKLMAAFFPGPLTVVLRRSERVPTIATAGLDTVGVRMPGNEIAREFLKACGTPVVAPSANLSGRPSPTTWEAVAEDLDGRIDCILQGGPTLIGLESTVVDCTADPPVILRQGAVTLDALRRVIPDIGEHPAEAGEAPRSPGLKHRHYSPHARVILMDKVPGGVEESGSGYIGLSPPPAGVTYSARCGSAEEYARRLFEFFRECDRRRLGTIYCETVPETGIGAALMDRLRRAAEG